MNTEYDFTFIPEDQVETDKQREFKVAEEEEMSPYHKAGKEAGRHLVRSLSRAGEAVVGIPGNIQSLVETGVNRLIGWAFGENIAKTAMQEDPFEKRIEIAGMEIKPGKLPTTQDLRKLSQALTGDKLEPQSYGEEIADEIVEDVASLMFPIGGKIPLSKSIGMSVIGTLGKEAVKEMGVGEKGQTATKLGLMLSTGLINSGSARNFASQEYKKAIDMIPQEAVVAPRIIEKKLAKFTSELQKGGISPQKAPAYQLSKQLQQTIKKNRGMLPVEELPAYRASINDYRFGKELKERGSYYLDRFDDVLNETLFEYGKQNPQFMNQYKKALTAYAGVKQTGKIARYISRKVDPNQFTPHTLMLFGHMGLFTPAALGAAGAAYGAAQSYKLFSRITKNKELRKYYVGVLENAAKRNSGAMINNLKKLDDELNKMDLSKEYDFDFEPI